MPILRCVTAAAGLLALISEGRAEPVWYYPCTGEVVTASQLDLAPVKNPGALQVVESKADAGITWNITYRDVSNNTGVGFADPTLGATRRATLVAVLEYFDSILAHGPVTVSVDVQASLTTGTGFLATGGTSWLVMANSFQTGLASTRIRTGTTPFPNEPDLLITVNFGYTWNSTLNPPAANQFDLFSVLVHEVGHGLGFSSLTNATGASVFGSNIRSVYARDFRTGNGQALFNSTAAFLGTPNWLTGSENGIRYNGPQATLVHGSGGPLLYTPAPFNASSLSHWDDSIAGNAVMRRNIPPGVLRREWLDFEIAALIDFGYTVRGVNTLGGWMIY